MVEAVVCASCPESYHDRVAELCLQHQVQKAFGKAGDMVNALSGKDWIPKWEAKVVMATVTKAQTLNSNKALILHCDAEMARPPALARAIKTEMASQEFRVRGEFIEISGFLERYQDTKSKTSKSTKENRKPIFFSVAALLSTVAVKLLLEVKKRSKISSPTETNKNQPNQHQPTKARVS